VHLSLHRVAPLLRKGDHFLVDLPFSHGSPSADAGVSRERRREFKAYMPIQYALAVDYIRQWVSTN
jgi:hypothetical protein